MACQMCEERGKTWAGDDPRCAFKTGRFSSDNWNCATMNALRDAAEGGDLKRWSEDQWFALLVADGRALALSWYKRRGRTEVCMLLEIEPRPPTENECLEILGMLSEGG